MGFHDHLHMRIVVCSLSLFSLFHVVVVLYFLHMNRCFYCKQYFIEVNRLLCISNFDSHFWSMNAEGVTFHESCCTSKWNIFSCEKGPYCTTLIASSWGESMACDEFEIGIFLLRRCNGEASSERVNQWLNACLALLCM